MPYVDFAHVRSHVQIEQVVAWLGLELKKEGDQLRGPCPRHDGGKRALVITPAKQLWYCFAPECQSGGDCIELVAKVRQISQRDAALALQAHFLHPQGKTGSADNPFKGLDYLQPDHDLVQALGISKEDAAALGIGYATRGTMVRRVLFPLRDHRGKLVGYIGINPELDPPVKLPGKLHL